MVEEFRPTYSPTRSSVRSIDPDAIREVLVKQLYNPVQWTHTIQIISDGADVVVECGPGKVLQGLMRKIDRNVAASGAGN